MDHRSTDRSARPQVAQRPVANASPAEEYTPQRPATSWSPSVEPKGRKKWPVIVGTIVAALVVIGLVWFLFVPKAASPEAPAGDRYQAVFLNNGQVFFGKLKNTDGAYLVLEDAYYTKKADVPANATAEQKAAIEANVSLAKVGSEVYGPETSMSIRAEQVLFWQNLKSDSKVSKAIKDAN